MSTHKLKGPVTVICQLQTVPAHDEELLKAMIEGASRIKIRAGFLSQEIYKCPEGQGYTSVAKWKSAADHEATMEDTTFFQSCPVGALIHSGKVRINVSTSQPLYTS